MSSGNDKTDDAFQKSLQHELLGEKASCLGRVTQRLEAALTALAGADEPGCTEPGDLIIARRQLLLEEAAEWLWYVVVQREAMGLVNHRPLFELYAVPAEVRRRMGPRQRR